MVVEVHFLAKKVQKLNTLIIECMIRAITPLTKETSSATTSEVLEIALLVIIHVLILFFFLFSIALLPMTPFPYKYFNCVPQILCRVITKLSYMFLLVAKCYLLILSLVNSGLSPRTLIYRDCRRHSHFPDFLKQLPSHCFSALLERQLRHKQPNQSLTTPHLCCLDTGHAPK